MNTSRHRYSQKALAIAAMALISFGFPLFLYAGASIVTLDVEAESESTAQLTITPAAIHFPNANPNTVPAVPALENPVSVTANAQVDVAATATLTVIALGDLISGSDTISSDKISWTASGDGFIAGTMSKDAPVTAGSWVGPGDHSGTFSYFLANSWSYATGNYTQTVTYTLIAP